MKSFHVRDILKMSEDEVWATIPHLSIDDKISLTFDNKETRVVQGRATIFSQYFWNFHRHYPDTQVLPEHHLQDKLISKRVYLQMMSDTWWDTYRANESKAISREVLMRMAYQHVTNKIYNMITTRLSPYVTSISNSDILEVVEHPKIKDANDNVGPTYKNPKYTVDECHDIITNVLMKDRTLIKNPLAYAAQTQLVDINQIKQVIGPRGYPSDVDDFIFHRTPILPSFYKGITEYVDALTESRSAAKAHFFQKAPMERSEYLNRSTQLLCMSLQRLHMTDCGSRSYLDWHVAPDDVGNLVGMRMLDPKTNQEVWASHTNLKPYVGKTIKLRSIIYCQHPDDAGVCLHCFGAIGYSIPHGTNVGYVSSAIILGDTGQNLLSTKHLVASAEGNEFYITDDLAKWIRRHSETGTVGLNPAIQQQKVSLVIPRECGPGLNDIDYVDDVNVLQKNLVSKFSSIVFAVDTGHHTTYHDADLGLGAASAAHLTHAALAYIKSRKFTITPNEEFVIPLDKWDFTQPFLEIPLKQYSTVDFMMSVDRAITGAATGQGRRGSSRGTRIVDYSTPADAVRFFYDLVNTRLNCSLAHTQVIVYCLMCADPDNHDYGLPKKGMPNKLTAYSTIMRMRSLAPFLAFERQYKTFVTPWTYLLDNRQAHPMDPIFVPSPEPAVYSVTL